MAELTLNAKINRWVNTFFGGHKEEFDNAEVSSFDDLRNV